MRKTIALLLSLALTLFIPAPSAEAAYNGTNTLLTNAGGSGSAFYIPGTFPFTFGVWVKPSSLTTNNEEIIFTSGHQGGGGWKVEAACANSVCACTGTPVSFVKLAVVVVCSTQTLTTNVWQFLGVVVTSTNVHFVTISAAGTVVTQDVSNSSAINTCSSSCNLQVQGQTTGSVMPGSYANLAVWGSSLSDAELKAYAFQGLSAIGRAPAVFFSLFNTAATTSGQGDLGTGTANFQVTATNTPTTVSHAPSGNPFNRH